MSLQESQNVEFKRIWRDEYLKTICAFANTDGGALYIGFDNNAKAIGLNDITTLTEVLPNKINNRLGLVESWGKGTNNIIDDCKKMGLPEPEYKYACHSVQIVFYKTTQEIKKLSTKEQILEALKKHNSLTREELASIVGVSSEAVKQHISNLKKEERLERVGSTKSGYWRVKGE